MAFPAEVLLLILRLVIAPRLMASTKTTFFMSHPQRPPLHSPELFPYSVAAVCKTWDFVASMAPEFWSLVVIFLESTPLDYAKDLLLRSKNLPIEVHILENKPLKEMDPPMSFTPERVAWRKLKMQQLVTAITPHLHRCERLKIQVVDCQLLPRLSDIQAPAPQLTRLALEANPHGRSHIAINKPESQPVLFVPSPDLRELTLDGSDWYPWFQSLLDSGAEFRNLISLTLSNLNLSKPGQSSFDTMDELATTLGSVTRLSVLDLRNIRAEECVSQPDQQVMLQNLEVLYMTDCESEFLWSFFSFMDMPSLVGSSVVRCPVDAMLVPQSPDLHVEGIDALNDLGGFLKDWDGVNLVIKDCPAFDNHTLRTLSGNRYRPPGHENFCSLEIWNSFGFTLEVLQDFVQVRSEVDGGHYKFNSLFVYGAPYNLSSDDLAWFKARLSEFSWKMVYGTSNL
ncbi:hypothetical protein BDN72DRAFT_856413 [Pluteus cervinus]|uniref:Uncharacterized protein n=1 Tax=Pluteus cervinus TaxID=181527 RepID=A0ACD3AZG9_9AGAR|nr:hypothetical protein BDN72DRAFT_856413 [Pluteus cervinus]